MKRDPERLRIVNLNMSCRVNGGFLKTLTAMILRLLRKRNLAALEIVFLNDRAIRRINKRYKRQDRPTDVLSFRMDLDEFGKRGFLGEVFISLDTARRNAKTFGTAFAEEITLYIIHGILHLCGYDDEKPGDRHRMREKEEELLSRLCEREDLSKVLMTR
jgi:probable rRNA maturation factor